MYIVALSPNFKIKKNSSVMSEKEAQSLSLFQKDFLSLISCSSKCHHKYGCNKPKRKSEPKNRQTDKD